MGKLPRRSVGILPKNGKRNYFYFIVILKERGESKIQYPETYFFQTEFLSIAEIP